MTPSDLPFLLPGCQVDQVREQDGVIQVTAHSVDTKAICPACRQCTKRIHSYYLRSLADLPVSDRQVRLCLRARRFRCQTKGCRQVTFVERLPRLVAPHGQRTERLTAALVAVALALGGAAGSRLATKLNMPTSGDTLLRIIRATPEPVPAASRVIGVDDWAKRRGHLYGTILVDLERRPVTDLLSDRTADTLAAWLRAHPTVKVVARDRSGEYARAITLGAPHAKQVADRWQLLVTLREACQRLLDRLRPELQLKMPKRKGGIPLLRRRRRSGQQVTRYGRWVRRLALYEKIHRLR